MEKKTDEQKEIEYLKSLTYKEINAMFKKLRIQIQELQRSKPVNADACVHPFDSVISKCDGEINYCLRCFEDI